MRAAKGSGGAVTKKEVPSLSMFQIQLELRMRVSTTQIRAVCTSWYEKGFSYVYHAFKKSYEDLSLYTNLNIFLLPLQQDVKLSIIYFVYVLHVITMRYKTMRISVIKSVNESVQFCHHRSKEYNCVFCRAWLTDVKRVRKSWKFARCVCSLKWFYGTLSMGTQFVCVCVCMCLIED